jgi:hypothetical protein
MDLLAPGQLQMLDVYFKVDARSPHKITVRRRGVVSLIDEGTPACSERVLELVREVAQGASPDYWKLAR